jgi:DNA-binding transcriptional MerR regulator/copper chaperone CopZ
MTIARAAEQAGVGVETIRFYERKGLIEQPLRPRDGGYREYDRETVARIHFIRQAQELGFSLREIGELLALRTDPNADCSDVRLQAVTKRRDVDGKIAQLEDIRSALDVLIARCPGGGDLSACTIMDALNDRETVSAAPQTEDGTSETSLVNTTFHVDGMHCEVCARTVEALLAAEPGVGTASVSFERREAGVSFNQGVTSAGRLTATAAKGGYRLNENGR